MRPFASLLPFALLVVPATAFPWLGGTFTPVARDLAARDYSSVESLTEPEIANMVRELRARNLPVGAQPPSANQTDRSAKLVNDKKHRFIAPKSSDQRGPCPGLNTLANHGYLPRDGIASPQQIMTAVQDGFNMDFDLAAILAYGAMLVDGNPVTNLISIGSKTSRTGPNPPSPAIIGGLSYHGTFEGDASTTRSDAAIGDNHSFNETLFQVLVDAANQYGNGTYDVNAAAQLVGIRWRDSVARNPSFQFQGVRVLTAYAEKVFPFRFFVDGRSNNGSLDLTSARGFFQTGRMPDGFYRRNGTFHIGDDVDALAAVNFLKPGYNQGVNNYIYNTSDLGLASNEGICVAYKSFGYDKVPSQYPNATGILAKALQDNLDYFGQQLDYCDGRIILYK